MTNDQTRSRTAADNLAPTARLRFVLRTPLDAAACSLNAMPERILQQWWAEDVPGYMRRGAQGEWRDVEVGVEAP
jgi:hypothetical protein